MDDKSTFKRLWAPWRMPWIKESSGGLTNCFLCDIIADSPENDRENLLLYRGNQAVIVLNRYPYCNGHLMVAPVRHIHDPRQFEPAEIAEIGLLVQLALDTLTTAFDPDGFNLGYNIGRISGAGLEEHVHQHIVPRWNGDTNFMPVVGKTKVISQDLWDTYDELLPALRSLKAD